MFSFLLRFSFVIYPFVLNTISPAEVLYCIKSKGNRLYSSTISQTIRPRMSTIGDYEAVRKDIVAQLKKPDYDDGSAGPVFVRLAW